MPLLLVASLLLVVLASNLVAMANLLAGRDPGFSQYKSQSEESEKGPKLVQRCAAAYPLNTANLSQVLAPPCPRNFG